KTEPAVARYRVGLDGLPIVYRFKSEPGKKYVVCLVTTPHIGGYYLKQPKAIGDLVYEYRVESCEVKTLDYIQYEQAANRPLYVEFTGAADANGDGYIEVSSGVTPDSRIRHTRLSVIYVFPQDLKIVQPESVYSGEMNDQCIWHINVGATPEQDWRNQQYDLSDIGLARLKLSYTDPIAPGEIKTFWLKVPPIHRREPVSMGYIAHAFREVLPGEAVPPFGTEKLAALKALDPAAAEESLKEHWNAFFAKAAKFSTPDSILNDIFLSRLATRAILDTRISQQVYYNPCSPFFYFDHAYRDQAYVVYAYDMAGLHDRAERLLQVYCMDAKDVTVKGPISFDGQPLQLGMLENGLWNTRPGQYDTQGQNIWALVQHYKLSGDRDWLEKTAYPFIKRGAMWIVESRQRHMKEVKDPNDLRYGLIEPGGMEVMEVGKGMHMYYMNGFAILGLSEAADAAQALGLQNDADLFTREGQDLKDCLHRSFTDTFKRTGLYEGHLWFGVEPEGVGMYGFWAHNCLLWPCRCFDPHDPMLSATWRKLEQMSNAWGGGLHSEGAGGFWPYIGADRGISHILRGEPDKALDYFCAFTDTAGGTLSWGEGYNNVIAAGDQPHFWADAQWINLFRHLFVMEDGATLMITPAAFRRWTSGSTPVRVESLPTEFGDLTLRITPDNDAHSVAYSIRITPKGDQAQRSLDKLLLYPRIANGKCIQAVLYNNQPIESFTNDVIVLPKPPRNQAIEVRCILSRDF
ncbi:MAG TPA: hypothetical protein PLI09_00690, partial [Candidatus Hydrogenedentes bacterium]|nr:hypothetical protein [Candidatus Hydrogenedentota bacterium]